MSTPPWCKCQASLPPNNQRGTHRPPLACGLGHSYSVRLHAVAVLQIFITLKNDSSTVIAWVKQKRKNMRTGQHLTSLDLPPSYKEVRLHRKIMGGGMNWVLWFTHIYIREHHSTVHSLIPMYIYPLWPQPHVTHGWSKSHLDMTWFPLGTHWVSEAA